MRMDAVAVFKSLLFWVFYAKLSLAAVSESIRLPRLSSTTTVVNGLTYIATASSTCCGEVEAPWKAFDKTNTNFWTILSHLYYANGDPVSGVQTVAEGVTYVGEWLQIQLPLPSPLFNYSISSRYNAPTRGPKQFVVLGSHDGSTWYLVDARTDLTWEVSDPQLFVVSTDSNIMEYTFYRLVTTKKLNYGDPWLSIGDWDFNVDGFSYSNKTIYHTYGPTKSPSYLEALSQPPSESPSALPSESPFALPSSMPSLGLDSDEINSILIEYLPTFLPTYLPTFLPTYLPAILPTHCPKCDGSQARCKLGQCQFAKSNSSNLTAINC